MSEPRDNAAPSDPVFQIGAPGVDTESLVRDIRERVAEKARQGLYRDVRVARAERHNLAALRNQDEFFEYYMDCLREASAVDINDFEIDERRSRFAPVFVALKRTIWKLLKFYTYRLWSQQNQVNGLVVAAVESVESRYRERLRVLEKRVADLESAATQARGPQG